VCACACEQEAFGAIDQSGVLILAGYWNLYKYPSARSLTVGSIVATGNVNKLCSMTDITQHFSRGHRAGVVLHSSRGATVSVSQAGRIRIRTRHTTRRGRPVSTGDGPGRERSLIPLFLCFPPVRLLSFLLC
jgi:hypothetical protein